MKSKNIIKSARQALRGNLCASIVCLVTPALTYLLIKSAEMIIRRRFFPIYDGDLKQFLILSVILTAHAILLYPLLFGCRQCFYQSAHGEKMLLYSVFCAYDSAKLFFRASFTMIIKRVVLTAFTLIFCVPSYLFLQISFERSYHITVQIIAAFLLVLAIFSVFVLYYSLFLTEYIVIDSGKNPFFAVFSSIRLMHGHKFELLTMQVKLIPWFLLCAFIIPIIYVVPLCFQSAAMLAKSIIDGERGYARVSSADNEKAYA